MYKAQFIKVITVSSLVFALGLSIAACGKKDDSSKASSSNISESSTPSQLITLGTTTTVPTIVFSGSLAANDEVETWTVTPIVPALTKYVNVNTGYLKVRKGPGVDYDQVAALSKNMQVVVIGKTDGNWYKLDDGYYVSGDYLSDTTT
jgi:uncharacterized protein YgiM (DUF1202 family)